MTLVEFVAPLSKAARSDLVLAVLYYKHRYDGQDALTVEQVRQGLHAARIANWSKINVADVLAKSGHYVDSPGTQGNKRLWKMTSSGDQYVRELLKLPATEPEVEHDVGSLSAVAAKLKDADVKDYVDEAIKCLQVGALRASVVFLWTGAVRTLQNELLTFGVTKLNAALQRHDPKCRLVTKIDDFDHVKDKYTLLAARDLALLDKGEKDTLEEALNLRNRCGHPTKYKPGPKKVSSFIEDIISVIFS